MSENRHPAGTSIGGQWAPGSASEIDDELYDGPYDIYDERGNPVADEGRRGSTGDANLDETLERIGVYSHRDCPGLAEAWARKYGTTDDPGPEADKRFDHILGAENGVQPPWSVLADEEELADARSERSTALILVSDAGDGDTPVGSMHFDSARSIRDILDSDDPEAVESDYYDSMTLKYFFDYDTEALPENSDAASVKALRRRELEEQAQGVSDGPAGREAQRMRRSTDALIDIQNQRNQRIDEAVGKYNDASDKVWSLGWTGERADMPPRPKPMKASAHYV